MEHINYSSSVLQQITQELLRITPKSKKGQKKKKKVISEDTQTKIRDLKWMTKAITRATKYILPPGAEFGMPKDMLSIFGKKLILPYDPWVWEIPPSLHNSNKVFILLYKQDEWIEVRATVFNYSKSSTWHSLQAFGMHEEILLEHFPNSNRLNPNKAIRVYDGMRPDSFELPFYVLEIMSALASTTVRKETRTRQITSSVSVKKDPSTKVPLSGTEEYQYVYIDIPKPINPPSAITEGDRRTIEERFRPQEHKRKAHQRKYKSGKIVDIPELVINSGVGQYVEKKYIVRGPKQHQGGRI